MSAGSGRTARWVATVGGLGDLLPAPGTTAGSAPAAALWWALVLLLPDLRWLSSITAVLVVVSIVVGIWAADLEEKRRGGKDPGPVVIDEVAGQWVTFAVMLPWVELGSLQSQALVVAVGFFGFRLFDITKPWPCRRLESLGGGFGIMADDLIAGIYAGLVGIAVVMASSAWLFVP